MNESDTFRIVLGVIIIALSASVVMYPNTRADIMAGLTWFYNEIRCIMGSECVANTADDRTAVESTKALACSIDAVAYWSDLSGDGTKKSRFDEILGGKSNYDLFHGMDDKMLPSCDSGLTAPAPNAVSAHTGSILSKLSEWSGGGKITGMALGNRITGFAGQEQNACSSCGGAWNDWCDRQECESTSGCAFTPELGDYSGTCAPEQSGSTGSQGTDWCAKCKVGLTDECTAEQCLELSKKQMKEDPKNGKYGKCAFEWGVSANSCRLVDYGADMCGTCDDGIDYCKKDYCEKTLSDYQAPLGTCKFDDGTGTNNDCKPDQDAKAQELQKQHDSEKDATEAEKTVAANKGRAIAFGKTVTVCGKTGGKLKESSDCCRLVDEYSPTKFRYAYQTGGSCSVGGMDKGIKVEDSFCENDAKFSCQVKAFELPQKVKEGDVFYGPLNYLTVTKDPKYVVFNEKFPEGARENWNIDGTDVAVVYIATAVATTGIFDCALPGAGRILGKTSEKAAQTAIGQSIIGKYEKAGELISRVKSSFGRIVLRKGLNTQIKQDLVKAMTRDIVELAELEATKITLTEFGEQTFERTLEKESEQLAGLAFEIAEGADQAYVMNARNEMDALLKAQGSKKTVDEVVDAFKNDGKTRTALLKLTEITELKIPMMKTAAKSGAKTIDTLKPKELEKALNEIKTHLPEGSKFELASKEIKDDMTEETVGKVVYKLVPEKNAGQVSAFLRSMGVSTSVSKSKGAMFLVAGMVGIWGFDQMINMNDPSNCGTNTMCLFVHDWPVSISAGMKQRSEMAKDTNNLWVELGDSDQNGPLYFASPCKADLNVKKEKCWCKSYYGSDNKYLEISIEEWGKLDVCREEYVSDSPECQGPPVFLKTFNVDVPFPHTFKFEEGKTVKFKYAPETGAVRDDSLQDGDKIEDPKRLEDALRTMKKEDLKTWMAVNANKDIIQGNEFRFANAVPVNFEQGTTYKKCAKGDWWKWGDEKEVDCVKISAEDVPAYRPNFCYEKSFDSADTAELAVLGAQVVAGLAAAAAATPETFGAGALPAYCGASMGVSVAGAWILSGTVAEDKWPNGISQSIIK